VRPTDEMLRRLPDALTELLAQHRGVEVRPADAALIGDADDPDVGWERVRARGVEPPPDLIVKGWQITHRPRP
jgi:hypothetical protein